MPPEFCNTLIAGLKCLLSTLCLCILFYMPLQGQGFEGVIESVTLFKHDSIFKKKTIATYEKLGWEKLIQSVKADSICRRIYIRHDSIWMENWINNDTLVKDYCYQAGMLAYLFDPQSGVKTQLGNHQEIEDFLDKNSNDPNWRDKINVGSWFKTDYSKLKRLPLKKIYLQGYLCTPYSFPAVGTAGEVENILWLAEDFPFDKQKQALPFHFNGLFTPRGLILRNKYTSPDFSSEHLIRRIKPGPVAPILPRWQALQFVGLEKIQYADQVFNAHLQGKTIADEPRLPDFSYYPLGSQEKQSFHAKKELGKFILIDLWATWCGPCLREMPKLKAFQEEHAAVLEVLGFNCGDSKAEYVERVAKKYNMNWPQAYAGDLLKAYLNPDKSIPHAILVDHEMKVLWRGNPAENWGKIEAIIRGN
jgi:thiol-disulfide isomerase/thioredoxin